MAKNKLQIANEIELVETMRMLSQAYEEIAVLKMQRVRGSVLSTRDFLERFSKVFADVRRSYRHQIDKLSKKHKDNKYQMTFSTITKNKKTVAVLISANANFYGDIVRKVYNLFLEAVKKDPTTDIVIMGKLGKTMFDNSGVKREYKYFDLPDNSAGIESLKDVVTTIIQYEKVNVFYGRFANVVTQEAASSDVSGELSLSTGEEDPNAPKEDYFFEPSLKKILEFFESSVFTSMFTQTVHEAELSRLASRIRAMEEALGNIEKTEAELHADERRLTKSMQNKRQQDMLSKIYLLVK